MTKRAEFSGYDLHQFDDRLVGDHDDGRVGQLADELGGEPPVQSALALLVEDQHERLAQ